MQLKLGLPTGFESILFAITNIAIQSAINTFGTDTTAAWSAFGKLDAIFWMISTAFGISITTFVGQNYGAGKMDRVRRSTLVCLGMDLAVSFVLVAVLIAARGILFRLFTTDEAVVRIGSDMLMFIIPWYIIYVFIEVLGGSLRGRGNVLVPVVITLLGRMRPENHLAGGRDEDLTDDPLHYLQLPCHMGRDCPCIYWILLL